MSDSVKGIAASNGIAIARAFVLENPELRVETKSCDDPKKELNRLETALEKASAELEEIRNHAEKEIGAEQAEIFSAHLLVLKDPEFIGAVKEKIQQEKLSAESALRDVTDTFIQLFENMENEYMKERATDIRDVSKRVLAHLLGVVFTTPAAISEESIIIASDLTPSDTAQFNRKFVKGFTTDIGGRTSHSAIMARSLEIPAVVGTKSITKAVKPGVTVIVDGIEGVVIVDPSDEQIAEYEQKRAEFAEKKERLRRLVNEVSRTRDGEIVELAANIGSPEDLDAALENGAEAIGLYRTEFLYMGRQDLPDEEEQYNAYREVVEKMAGKPVVIRTLDIGGDKELPYLDLPEELNPFLGFRAIRLCLERDELFRTQIRALLRASAHGNVKVMFPMVATLEEFRTAKKILQEEYNRLAQAATPLAEKIEVGMMVEVPSAAVMARQFAREVDFFSIGTNDLIQYTMAADRMNERVSYLYQPYIPAVLQLIYHVIKAAHEEGKWVGMCGEMAGDPLAIPLLLGFGLDEFSMSATSILPAREQLLSLSKEEAKTFAESVLHMDSAEQVVRAVKEKYKL